MADNKILIVSEYTDLSSAKIKQSFAESEAAVDKFSAAIDRMNQNMTRTMDENTKKTVEALKSLNKGLNDTKPAADNVVGGAARMAKAYEALRIEVARIRNAVLLATFALRPLIDFTKQSIAAASEQEDATHRLNTALQLQGFYTEATSKKLVSMAQAFQTNTKYGDENIENVMQRLIAVGDVLPGQMERVTKATLDYAAATGRDLPTAANVVSKAMAGFTGELSRYGIFIDQSTPKSQKAEAALKALEKHFGGSAQKDVETYSGRIEQMKNRYNDLQEAIGQIVIERTHLDSVVQFWGNLLKSVTPSGEPVERLTSINNELNTVRERIKQINAAGPMNILFPQKSENADPWNRITESRRVASDQMGILQAREAILVKLVNQESEATKKIAENRKFISDRVDSDAKISQSISNFSNKFTEYQNENKEVQLKILNQDYAAYQDLLNRKLEIEKNFTDELAKEQAARSLATTDSQKKEIDSEIASINARKTAYEDFLQHSGDLAEMKRAEFFKVVDKSLDYIDAFGKAASNSLADGFFDVATGRFRDLTSVAVNFGETLLRELSKIAANEVFAKLGVPGFVSILGGIGGIASAGMGAANAVNLAGVVGAAQTTQAAGVVAALSVLHGGGPVRMGMSSGSGTSNNQGRSLPFAGHYRTGGEVHAILHEGEGVVNKDAMANLGVNNLNKLNRGNGIGGSTTINNYYIQTIDERSFRDRLNQNGDIFAGATERGIADNRSIRKTMQRYG